MIQTDTFPTPKKQEEEDKNDLDESSYGIYYSQEIVEDSPKYRRKPAQQPNEQLNQSEANISVKELPKEIHQAEEQMPVNVSNQQQIYGHAQAPHGFY